MQSFNYFAAVVRISSVLSLLCGSRSREVAGIIDGVNLCQHLRGKEFTNCLTNNNNFTSIIKQLTETNDHLSKFGNRLSRRFYNYAVMDETIDNSQPLYNYTTSSLENYFKPVEVTVLLNKSHAKIWLVHDFITDDECDVLINHAWPLLGRAVVAGDNGSNVVSDHRKAEQALYNLNKHNQSDPLW